MKDKADWSCDSCHTNNYAQQSICRVCGRQAGSATGVLALPDHQPLSIARDETVAFVESRHKELPRATIALAPVPPSRPGPPGPLCPPKAPARSDYGVATRTPRAPRPPVSGRAFWRGVRYLLVAILVIIVITNLDRIGSLLGSAETSGVGRTATSCPTEVARWLPGNGDGAELVARHDTGKHVVTICLDSAGSYRYDGQLKGRPVTSDNHISLPAERTPTGFTAVNGEYRYEISGQALTISRKGKVLSHLPLAPTPS
ncbi:zinc finger Ran-binding domain-containing protein [Crossiella sp. NPDC003009]